MVTKRLKFALWWERIEMPLRLGIFILGAMLVALIVFLQRPEFEIENFSSNLTFFILINLNIALLCIFVFLVGKNIIKLVFDRRKNILGSKLKGKLIFAFVGLTLVPTVITFVFASGLISRYMDDFFSKNILEAITSADDITRNYYRLIEKKYLKTSSDLSHAIFLIGVENKLQVKNLLDNVKKEQKIKNIVILDKDKKIKTRTTKNNFRFSFSDELFNDVIGTSKSRVSYTQIGKKQIITFYYPFSVNQDNFVLVLNNLVNSHISRAIEKIKNSYKEYESLMFHKNPMRSSYLLTLAMMTMLILFAAIWIAFYIAKEIIVPIEKLANATKSVALGDYDCTIKVMGNDELSYLAKSFNVMISDLKQSKNETERHRLFLETVLSNLAVGVITLNRNRKLIAVNSAASDIFNLTKGEHPGTQSLEDIFDKNIADSLEGLLNDSSLILDEFNSGMTDTEVTIRTQGREYQLVCTAGAIIDSSGDTLGNILIFDDVTDLSHAQKMAAWREVARRIAHEIKNPLTPIKLSAQRIQRNATMNSLPSLYKESTDMIIQQVDNIKRLVDEFSNFARMPTASFEKVEVVSFLKEVFSSFLENNKDITFISNFEENELEAFIDVGQIRQVLLNLFENAMQALRNSNTQYPRIWLSLKPSKNLKIFTFEISDNGPGISDKDKTRIFEPYYTTKESGTGLGLAIVTSVISDHGGRIRIFDNKPKGAKFVITLPKNHSDIAYTKTQRRFNK